MGAELALYHSLKAMGKNVKALNVDPVPRKYKFLSPEEHIQIYENDPSLPEAIDLVLIFDTNDERMLDPLYQPLKERAKKIQFIDHHPLLLKGPQPPSDSLIDTTAASTGELAWKIIKALGSPINREVARALYTSITFDTQLYRFIRNSPTSHIIAAEMLTYDIDPEEIHRHLFGNQTVNKVAFLAKALGQIEYHCEGRLAILRLRDEDMMTYGLDTDDSRDVVDLVMNIETLQAAALFREDSPDRYKVSLRSQGQIEVVDVAESIGGGGHPFAAGAVYTGPWEKLKSTVVNQLIAKLDSLKPTGS